MKPSRLASRTQTTTAPRSTISRFGGKFFRFNGHTDIKQEAVYAQDSHRAQEPVAARGRTHRQLRRSQPALAGPAKAWRYVQHQAVEHGAAPRLRQVDAHALQREPAALRSYRRGRSAGRWSADAAEARNPLAIQRRLRAGHWPPCFIVNAEYFWKYTDRDFDFDALLNSPLAFPIQWQKSKIDGFGIKLTVPERHGLSAYAVLGHTRARFFSPEVGGILFNDPSITTISEPFRIDHDQAFQQSTNLQYQPKKTAPWFGLTWRYESGAVAGSAPFSTSANPSAPVDLTYLSADQQAQILLTCGNVQATRANPIGSCAGSQLSSPLLRLPPPGTENDDRNPPRVAPRTLFDMALGWDDVLHHYRPSERLKTNLSITAVNVTNKFALYNFLSTFSGTHFVSPRTVSAQVTFNF